MPPVIIIIIIITICASNKPAGCSLLESSESLLMRDGAGPCSEHPHVGKRNHTELGPVVVHGAIVCRSFPRTLYTLSSFFCSIRSVFYTHAPSARFKLNHKFTTPPPPPAPTPHRPRPPAPAAAASTASKTAGRRTPAPPSTGPARPPTSRPPRPAPPPRSSCG